MVRPLSACCTIALTIFAGLTLTAQPAQAQQEQASTNSEGARLERRLQAVRAAGPMTLNGVLDEPAWATAPMAEDFIQSDPREGQPATFDTQVRVLYDDDSLYFGVFAEDEEPGRLK